MFKINFDGDVIPGFRNLLGNNIYYSAIQSSEIFIGTSNFASGGYIDAINKSLSGRDYPKITHNSPDRRGVFWINTGWDVSQPIPELFYPEHKFKVNWGTFPVTSMRPLKIPNAVFSEDHEQQNYRVRFDRATPFPGVGINDLSLPAASLPKWQSEELLANTIFFTGMNEYEGPPAVYLYGVENKDVEWLIKRVTFTASFGTFSPFRLQISSVGASEPEYTSPILSGNSLNNINLRAKGQMIFRLLSDVPLP